MARPIGYRVDSVRRIPRPDYGPEAYSENERKEYFYYGKGQEYGSNLGALLSAGLFAELCKATCDEVSLWHVNGDTGRRICRLK